MSFIGDQVNSVKDWLAKRTSDTTTAISGVATKSLVGPGSQLVRQAGINISSSAMSDLASNPIINAGVDRLNSAVTTMTQQLLQDAADKFESAVNTEIAKATGGDPSKVSLRKSVDDAMSGFYTTMGLVSTAKVEVLMELARTNARGIIDQLDKKDKAIADIQTEVTALYNAITLVLNSQPFFATYFPQLIAAYGKIDVSNKSFKSVVSTLTSVKRYNTAQYNAALQGLIDAQTLILPDRHVTMEARHFADFMNEQFAGQNSKTALAAAIAIPGITATLAVKFAEYATYTETVNGFLTLFYSALSDWIRQYKRNDNIDLTTINHIKAGTRQLDSLLADMKVILFPTAELQASNLDVYIAKVPTYPAKVTTSATGWGIRLTEFIEWFKVQPGKAAQEMDITGESVTRYNTALAALKAIGDITVDTATLKVTEAKEDIVSTTKTSGKILIMANTVVFTQNKPTSVRAQFLQLRSLFSASKLLDDKIRAALTPFINTPNELIAGSDKVVKNLISMADHLGLDRAASLLKSGSIEKLFGMNASTATFVGGAVVGVTEILSSLLSSKDTTDQDVAKIEKVKSAMDAENEAKKVEMTRSSSYSFTAYEIAQQQSLAEDTASANQAIELAKNLDDSVSDSSDEIIKRDSNTAMGNRMNFNTYPQTKGLA